MELTNIIAAVPAGEHFDATAVNEGVWMSKGHLESIENVLAVNASRVSELENQISADATRHTEDAQALGAQLATAQGTITAHEQTIADLKAEVATLKNGAASQFSNTSKQTDDLHEENAAAAESDTTKEARKLISMRGGKKASAQN